MRLVKTINNLCSPALLYLVLSMIALVSMATTLSLMSLGIKTFFIVVWTWFLNYLCKIGHTGISWFLVLLPFICMLLIFFFALDALKMHTNLNGCVEGFVSKITTYPILKENDPFAQSFGYKEDGTKVNSKKYLKGQNESSNKNAYKCDNYCSTGYLCHNLFPNNCVNALGWDSQHVQKR